MDWLRHIVDLVSHHGAAARVVIVETNGPTPRAQGSSMLVWAGGQSGKIGRREVETRALEAARRMIGEAARGSPESPPRWLREPLRFATGPVLGEATGGSVLVLIEAFGRPEALALSRLPRDKTGSQVLARAMVSGVAPGILDTEGAATPHTALRDGLAMLLASPQRMLLRLQHPGTEDCLLERFAPQLPRFQVYGTGLVARALVKVLAELPFRVVWVDSAPGHFPDGVPPGVDARAVDDIAAVAASAGPAAFHAVMTAAHDLDLAVCQEVLRAGQFAYLGVIGSRVKHERLMTRLGEDGFAAADLARLACPIGLPAIRSKIPAVIAVGIAAQALAILDKPHAPAGSPDGTNA